LFSILFAHAQTTYTWNVASGDLDAAGSWSPSRSAPAANDILVFDGLVQATATVTNIPTRETIGKLVISNACAVTFSSGTGTTGAALWHVPALLLQVPALHSLPILLQEIWSTL